MAPPAPLPSASHPLSALRLPNTRLAGLLLAVAAPLLWSIGGPIMRSVDADPWQITFWRSIAHAIPATLILLAWRGHWLLGEFRSAFPWTCLSALLLASTNVFHVLAMTTTTVANVLIVQSVSPLLVAILGWFLLGERVPVRGRIAIAVAFAGLTTVIGGSIGGGHLLGDGLALTVALFSAANVLLVRYTRAAGLAPTLIIATVLPAIIGGVLSDPFALSWHDIGLLTALGVVQLTLGVTCFWLALRRLPAAEVTLIALLEPVLGPIWTWLVAGEQPAQMTLIGGGIVVLALVINAALGLRGERPVPRPQAVAAKPAAAE